LQAGFSLSPLWGPSGPPEREWLDHLVMNDWQQVTSSAGTYWWNPKTGKTTQVGASNPGSNVVETKSVVKETVIVETVKEPVVKESVKEVKETKEPVKEIKKPVKGETKSKN
jgi:hypothetical protein